ncbi:MAG TPA: protein kinase, partial [Bryobacteraceae bacterium]|nr:protein kinase [Bryobacteraceae bacterium]
MSLVELALSRPPEERKECLRLACAGNTDLFTLTWNYVEAEERMQGFLLDPLYSPNIDEHIFEPGELLLGRFRIRSEVARGGMGVVYEAFDEKLHRRIALKAARAGFGTRLPPEVRNASEISHPNVCKIFEIHTARTPKGDVDFLTMEFLDGETLAERLQRQPLLESEARSIAQQICAGLAAAHKARVVHGDLKSNNVILTVEKDGSTRAVITDFGLARALATSHGNTTCDRAGGTPDYMAPELWRGERASIPSDIFALGVIVHELVAAKKPEMFRGLLLRRNLPDLPARWGAVVRRCLNPDTAQRPHSAEAVAKALGPPALHRAIGLSAVATLLIALSGLFSYQTAVAPETTVRLAVLPIEASGGSPVALRDLEEKFKSRIGTIRRNRQTHFVPVLVNNRRADLGDATHKMEILVEPDSGKLRVRSRISSAKGDGSTREWQALYDSSELRYVPQALAGVITLSFHLPGLPAQVNESARKDYLEAWSLTGRSKEVAQMLVLMERAVIRDPDSPFTHAGLAEAQYLKFVRTREDFWLKAAQESLSEAERRQPDVPEVHRVAGLLLGHSGEHQKAIAEFNRVIELDSKNADAYRRLGVEYERSGQAEEAERAYRRAIELNGADYRNFQAFGQFWST